MLEYIIISLFAAAILLTLITLLQTLKTNYRLNKSINKLQDELRHLKDDILTHTSADTRFLSGEFEAKIDRLRTGQAQMFELNRESTQKGISELSSTMQDGLHRFLRHTSDGIEKIRTNVDTKLTDLQSSNEKKLDEMRNVVDEKLAKTLEDRLNKSFASVSVQLESVHRGLGEMKTVAQSVGSLNRILSGSKSRGILGEVQLGQIIEDMLPSQLYDREVPTVDGSKNRVEYAVKLPGAEEGRHVYLPIDSKFPLEPYEQLLDAYESGDNFEIDAARKTLHARIKTFARDIREKYVSPPETTHFAVMFLPTEGLYAEVARDSAFFDALRQLGVIITGPTTFSAMLNSLQLGFKTLQLQKGAADIEKTLGAVKKEFGNFEDVLKAAHKKISQAGNEIENLVGTRTRAINRSLRDVQTYTGGDAPQLLGFNDSHGD